MLTCKQRLVADHTIGVADLMKPLEQFMDKTKDRNLWKQLQPPHGTSWKTSTPCTWICQLEGLFTDYIRIAPNTVLSGKKHKNAICRIDEANRVNFTKKSPSDFYDQVDDAIRMGLSHLRQVKQCPNRREQVYRKCDPEQLQVMDKLLSYIQLGKDEVEAVQDDSQASCTSQMVPTLPPQEPLPIAPMATTSAAAPRDVHNSLTPPKAKTMADCENIFDSIITQKDNEVDGVEIKIMKGNTEKGKREVKKTLSDPSATDSNTASPKRSSTFHLDLDEADKKTLEEVSTTKPIARDGKSQLQRLNQVRGPKPKKGKGKGKGKAEEKKKKKSDPQKATGVKPKAKAKSKGQKATPSTGTSSAEPEKTEKKTIPKPKKRPSAAVEVSQPSQPSTRVRGKGPGKEVPPETEVKPLFMTVTKDNHPEEPSRKVLRSRCTSRAYHITFDKLEREGEKNEDEIKAAAREAHKAAGAEFDQRWPLEPKGKGKGCGHVSSFTEEQKEAAVEVD